MYLEESPYQRDQLINLDQLVGRALDHGVDLGENHHQTIENYVKSGLLPRLLNGHFPATALDRLISIDKMLKKGKSLEEIEKLLEEERRNFLKKPMDLSTLVNAYKGASKSLLMLSTIGLLIFFGSYFVVNLPASGVKSSVTKPVGRVLAQFIKEAKPTNSTSTDPLGLTNVSKVITINERQEVTIQKTINASDTSISSKTNQLLSSESIKVDNLEVKNILSQEITFPNISGAGNSCVLTLDIASALNCDKNLLWTFDSIKNIADTQIASSFSNLKLTGTGINITRSGNNFALSLANEAILSIDGVKNNAGDIDFIAGSGITITPNDTNNTVTFTAAGGSSNADLLDSIDSSQFLRSDTSDNFTSGTLTFDVGTSLSVLGTFTCTNCIGDAAVPNTITASNYLLLAGGTMAGNIDTNTNLLLNIGAAGTDFTAGGGLNIATDLDVAGHTAFGATASVQTWALLNLNETISVTGARGIYLTPTFNPSSMTLLASLWNAPTFSPTSIATIGVYGISTDMVIGGSSTISEAFGVHIDTPTIAGSTVNTLYGLYVANQTGAGTNYAIYQTGTGGTNFFDATSTFGRTATGNDTLYAAVIEGSLCVDDTTPNCPAGPTAGAIYVENSVGAGNVSAFDISEYYPSSEPVEKGDLVVVDPNLIATVKKSNSSYQQSLIGIVSTDPAMVIDETNITFGKTAGDKFNPLKPYIALAGRVPTKVSGENGVINPGDPLTSSSIPGVAMKATASGPIVGKALESFTCDKAGSCQGRIIVFVSVGWYVAPLTDSQTSIDTAFTKLSATDINISNSITIGEKITMNKNGKLTVNGEVVVSGKIALTGDITISGKLIFSELAVKKDSGSAGSSQIPLGLTEIYVESSKVKSSSLINLTAQSEPDGVLFVKEKIENQGFIVSIKRFPGITSGTKVNFNWFILNQVN